MPTPGNFWLADRDATWTITSQGQALAPDAQGLEHLPRFVRRQFVETNVPGTGYGCGCAVLEGETGDPARRDKAQPSPPADRAAAQTAARCACTPKEPRP